jgi:hypothetical protein
MREYKRHLIPVIIALWYVVIGAAPGIQFLQPRLEGFHPLDEGPAAITPLNAEHPAILELKSSLFYDKENIDFEKRQITFSRVDSLGFTMWEYHFSEMSDYLSSRRNFVVAKSWYKDVATAKRESDAKKQERSLKMQWELPVQYPSWAQRILGNEPPRLTIDGNLTITMGFDRSRYQEGKESRESQSKTNDFGFDMNYQFGIQGTVGKLINVGIRVADNEVASDNNFKNFKIEYKESTPGEMEDEIIQEVIAGWTNFDMPGTELSGYAGGKDGLFGIKIKSKLGPLTLTTIASQEKGEAQKLNLSLKNGGSEKLMAAGDYRRNVFFFLDTLYRNYYNKNWGKDKKVSNGYVAPPHVDSLEVYLLQENYQNDQVQSLYDRKDENGLAYKFIKLIPDKHYEVFKDEGYIRFDTAINNDNMVAIYLRTSDPALNKGKDDIVWTLKPRTQIYKAADDPARFYLMWRNVYDLDTSQMASFELKLRRYVEGEKDTSLYEPTGNFLLSEVLKLSGKDGKPYTDASQIFDKEHEFFIVPPYDTCPTCNEPFNNPKLGEKYLDPIIYKYSPESQEWRDNKNIYTFKTTGTQKITSLNLGWQVMPNSELVKTSSGERLKKDEDYIIDYESGTLELTSPRALAAENVEVTFQQEAMFVPESKVFLGVRGEVALPFLSEKSFAGISLLFQNAGSNEIPRLEQEPYSKLLIDMNMKAEFEPEWMTWLINKIPLIKTEQPSSVVLEVEAANSRTNPNTENQAFVDDFEDSRKTYPLASGHESWSKASPPQYILYSRPGDSLRYDTIRVDSLLPKYPPAFDWFWFQPRGSEKDPIKQKVWKPTTSKPMSGDNNYDPILRLHCQPSPKVDSLKSRFYKSWAGIMTPISQSSVDRSRDKYFEFCMNKKESKGRKLIIQMGILNEDVSWNGGPPNKKGDREDTTLAGYGTKELDRGLDRIWDENEKYFYPDSSQTAWDSMMYGDERLGERFRKDPGKDNARENGREYENTGQEELRWRACRQQGDDRYEREDLNYDGTVQMSKNEKYFEFVLDLDSMSQYVDSTARVFKENGWAKYRIPIHEISHIRHAINDPTWTNIQMVRLIWTDFDTTAITTESSLWFSDIQFTGNYWIAQSDDSSTTRAEAVSLSNQEDEYYKIKSNTGLIHHEIMPGTKNDFESESALKILFDDVEPLDTAMVRKIIPFSAMDVSQYENLSLVYFGDKELTTSTENQGLMFGGQVEFVFRFGNNDSTYYEYHNVIKKGEWNLADIDLQALAELKDDYLVRKPGTKIDTSAGNYRVYSNRVGVEPSLTKISWMALGVRNKSSQKVSGTIWVNEMKVRGIHKLNGWAARATLKTKWADFFNFDASMNFNQGDFRTMSETGYAARESKFSGSVSGSMSLDRFLPKDLGISVPVGGSVASDITRPELKTGSDMRLQSDGVYGMVVDALHVISDDKKAQDEKEVAEQLSKSEQYGKKTFRGTAYTTYSKSAQSENPIVNMTADRISTSVNYSKSISINNMGPSPTKEIYKIRDENDDYTAKLAYDLTPRDNPTWRPFEKNEKKWAEKFKNYELALLPSTFKFNLADLTYGKSIHNETEKNVFNRSYRYDLNHSVNMNYSPISPLLSFDYSLNVNRDLDNSVDDFTKLEDKVKMAFKRDQNGWKSKTVLNGEKTRNQNVSMKLTPDLISWLSTDASYSSAFTSNMVTRLGDKNLYSNSSVHPQFSFNSTLQFESVFDKLADTTKNKTWGRFFDKLKKGYSKIGFRSVSFNYTSDMNLRNDYLNKQFMDANGISLFDYFKYQTGLSGRGFGDIINGTMRDRSGLGAMKSRQAFDDVDLYRNDTRSTDRKFTISTGLNFTAPFEISLSPLSFEFGDHVGVQAKDTAYFDSSRTYPKFQIGANTPALMKIKVIKQYFSSMTCNSSYNFEKIANWSSVPKFTDAVRHTFRPLISVSGQIAKTPISINYSCDKSSEHQRMGSRDTLINSETTDKKVDHTFTINYEIQKNSRLSEIKLFSWTIPVSGKTTISFKGNVNKETAEKKEGDQTTKAVEGTTKPEWEPTNKVFGFALSPKITYVFTDNINGETSYEYGQKKNNDNTTITNKFAIIINIRL